MISVSKQDAIKYLERKASPGWDACSDSLTISLTEVKYLIDKIYSQNEIDNRGDRQGITMTYRLKELRKKRGLTQSQVANVLGTNQSQYGKYENKKTQLSIENAEILANYFGVSTAYILGLEEAPETKTVPESNTIGELIKESGKQLTQISKETGIAYPTLSGYNQGIRTPKKDNANILANYFGVSVSYLLGLDDQSEMRANNFQILVKDSKKTLKIISEETGISYSTLGNYNQGTRNPKRENAEILAKYFGVSTAYIMGIDEASEAKVVPEYQMIGELFFNLLMDVTNQTVYEGVITTITLNHKKFKLTVEEIEDDDITRTED